MYQELETTAMSLRDDLSDNARVILEGLFECGGEANMTEIKQVTGLDESKTVLYHAEEYLEPSNFVEYEVIDDGSVTGITEFTLTDRGQDAVGSLIESTDDPNLVEQVEELREAVSDMKREVDTFHGRMDHIEEKASALRIENMDELLEEIDGDDVTLELDGDRFSELYEDEIGPVREFHSRFVSYNQAVSDLLRVLEDAGFIHISEGFREEYMLPPAIEDSIEKGPLLQPPTGTDEVVAETLESEDAESDESDV